MEQDINNLNEIIKLCNEELDNKDENVTAVLDLTDLLSLRNLIKAYKELEEKLNETLNANLALVQGNANSISVSLVEETIEELNKLITEAQKELGSASKEYTIYVYQKDILQELLEKRK